MPSTFTSKANKTYHYAEIKSAMPYTETAKHTAIIPALPNTVYKIKLLPSMTYHTMYSTTISLLKNKQT